MPDALLEIRTRRFGAALKAALDGVRGAIRRMNERGCLSRLSALERQDLGSGRVEQELKKWPWQE
jgi:hypothetical protein